MSNKVITSLIIDDEPRARETIREMLSTFCPQIEVIGEGSSVKTGIKAILQNKPKVVFLGACRTL